MYAEKNTMDDVTLPVDDSGGATPVQDGVGAVHVHVPDDGGGDGQVHTNEGGGMAEAADGGGHVRVRVTLMKVEELSKSLKEKM